MAELPVNVKMVGTALVFLDNEADLNHIYQKMAELLPDWKTYYKNEASFHGTIRATLEAHSPQSLKWDPSREAMFERVSSGRYRVLFPDERAAAIKKGRVL